MAYVLGLIFADGAILDVRKSSRTCYIQISNNDESLLNHVRNVMSSNHPITSRKRRIVNFRGKTYMCNESFSLRIGSKIIFQDLKKLGLIPRKSLTMKLPFVPIEYFCFFLRGYFDGDGCLNFNVPKSQTAKRVKVIFTSGSFVFLASLSKALYEILNTSLKKIHENEGAYQLRYRKKDGLKILSYIYKDLESAPYLERKYEAPLANASGIFGPTPKAMADGVSARFVGAKSAKAKDASHPSSRLRERFSAKADNKFESIQNYTKI